MEDLMKHDVVLTTFQVSPSTKCLGTVSMYLDNVVGMV